MADAFEPINIEGQPATGIWAHHPGSEGPRTWEPRRGKSRSSDDWFLREISCSISSTHSKLLAILLIVRYSVHNLRIEKSKIVSYNYI